MAIPRNLANFAPKLDSSGNPTFTAPTVFSAGTASLPSITFTGDTNTGIFSPGADTIAFTEGGAEAMRIDSSGNVGIGSTTIDSRLSVYAAAGAGDGGMNVVSGSTTVGSKASIFFNPSTSGSFTTGSAIKAQRLSGDGSTLEFYTTAVLGDPVVERARITKVGYFKASNTGSYPDGDTVQNHYFNSSSTSESCVFIRSDSTSISGMSVLFIRGNRNTTDNTFRLIAANNGNDTGVFNVRDSGNCVNTNSSYGGTSDIKLKQDIVDAASQWDDIKNIRVRKYRFKNNPTAPLSIGVIAQELETISPGLVESEDDYEEVKVPAVDKEGNPILNEDGTPAFETKRNPLGTSTKSVKYSVLYMKAVKALQEAQLRIETLEAQNAAFEARLASLEAK